MLTGLSIPPFPPKQVGKYETCQFGACPRVLCHSTPVLPCGRSDSPGLDTVKLYCPNCGDIYGPPSSKYANVDGGSPFLEDFLPQAGCSSGADSGGRGRGFLLSFG